MVKKQIPTETVGTYHNIVIRASAGTGKTFQLSNRYLNLLATGVDCQEILATTFTKKGAGEILDRIIQRLSRAALSPSHATRLGSELGIPFEQERAAEVLQKLLRNLHRMEIGTLDSFFNRVARVFSLELGLPPAWDIVDEQQIKSLSRRTIHEMLRKKDVVNLLPLLTKGDSNRKIATMVQDLVDKMYEIRRDSQAETWHRLQEVKTFLSDDELTSISEKAHAVAFKKGVNLPKHWEVVKQILDDEQWAKLAEQKSVQSVLDGINKYGSSNLPPEIITILQALIPHCRAWITNRLVEQNRATCELLGLYGERQEKIKAEMGQLRFDDVTERLVKFVSLWETDRFSFRLDHQIRHLLLDEFQDTSPTQWSVIEPFAKAVCKKNEPSRSFFCVGDMKQAIFGWRGGVAEIFDLVENTLEGLEKSDPLTKSYRSSQTVIDTVNEVFLNLPHFKCDKDVANRAVHTWQDWFATHSTAREELAGHVTVEYAADAKLETRKQGGRTDHLVARERNENVKSAAVQRVLDLHQSLPADKSIGVLVATNKMVGELIFKLQKAGVQASEEGGTPLTDSAAVELVLSALKLADHPGDSIARFHLSYSPLADRFGLQPETPENQSDNRTAAVEGAAKLRDQLVLEGYGPTIECLARCLVDSCTEREQIRLQHLVRLAYANRSDSQRWAMRPVRFVEYIRDEVKITDASSARVRVMTIHKSKGLEFDAVVLPMTYKTNGWFGHTPALIVGRPSPTEDIETVSRHANMHHRKLLPEWMQELFETDQERTIRERMCQLYVAMTRAVHALHLVCSFGHMPHDKSEAGVLLALLCPQIQKKKDREQGVVYERGDPEWCQKKATEESNPDDEIDSDKIQQYYLQNLTSNFFRPLSRNAKSMRGLSRVRPSMLEGGNRVKLSETLASPDRDLALEFGQLIHRCFEQICWIDEGQQVTDTALQQQLQQAFPGSNQIDAAIGRFRQLLAHENLKKLLSTTSVSEQHIVKNIDTDPDSSSPNRVEVHNEKRLAVLMDQPDQSEEHGLLIEGVVDRLVLVYEAGQIVAAEIVDFKYDQIDDSNLTQRIEFYRPQLFAYRAAVEKMLGLAAERISTRLVFVQTGQVVQVDSMDQTIDGSTELKLPTKKKPRPPKFKAKQKAQKPAQVQQTLWSDGDSD